MLIPKLIKKNISTKINSIFVIWYILLLYLLLCMNKSNPCAFYYLLLDIFKDKFFIGD